MREYILLKLSKLEMKLRKKLKTNTSEKGTWTLLTIALVSSVATSVVGTSVSAYGSYQQGQSQKKMNKYNADVASQNAMLEQRTAEQNIKLQERTNEANTTVVMASASSQEKASRRNQAILEGEQKGILAAQGVGGGSVTAADIASSTFDTALLDRQAIKYNADSRAWAMKNGLEAETWNISNNAENSAWNLNSQSKQYKLAGKYAAQAGYINAGSSLLQGASQTGMNVYNAKK